MIAVAVSESSQVAEVRRHAASLAQCLGFGEPATGRVAIVATELATNIVKYGTAGEVLIGTFESGEEAGLQLVALDKGGGLADLGEALRDGHSTGGSAGTGLGAVRRQSQLFDIVSWPGRGTGVLARLTASPSADRGAGEPFTFGAVEVALRGEPVSGDAYCVRRREAGWTVFLADGLGHGPLAAQASEEAVRVFRLHEHDALEAILGAVHAGIRHTRGGAVSVARYDPDRQILQFAGLGNVAGAVVTGADVKRTVTLAGTAGHSARRFQVFEYPFTSRSLFVMCSDGIGTSWTLDNYPGLTRAHPALIAGILYRDFARGRDDATVVVAGPASP